MHTIPVTDLGAPVSCQEPTSMVPAAQAFYVEPTQAEIHTAQKLRECFAKAVIPGYGEKSMAISPGPGHWSL